VYREPDGNSYARRIRHRDDDALQVAAFPDLGALPVGDIFPEETGEEFCSTRDLNVERRIPHSSLRQKLAHTLTRKSPKRNPLTNRPRPPRENIHP